MVSDGLNDTSARLRAAHVELEPSIARIRAKADVLDGMTAAAASVALGEIRRFVADDLLPHEELEDRTIYPMLATAMGSDDATASLYRTHQEIFRLARLLDRLVRDLPPEGPSGDDRTDLQRLLYGLEAILHGRRQWAGPSGRPSLTKRRRSEGIDAPRVLEDESSAAFFVVLPVNGTGGAGPVLVERMAADCQAGQLIVNS